MYEREAARQKLLYLVTAGLCAYFSHKVDEYGVYFFDPYYYENTEPFHESLRQCVTRPNTSNKSKLVASYFSSGGLTEQFKFLQHSAYSVSICKQPGVKIVTNTTGIIVSMINNQVGTLYQSTDSIINDKVRFSRLPSHELQSNMLRTSTDFLWTC